MVSNQLRTIRGFPRQKRSVQTRPPTVDFRYTSRSWTSLSWCMTMVESHLFLNRRSEHQGAR